MLNPLTEKQAGMTPSQMAEQYAQIADGQPLGINTAKMDAPMAFRMTGLTEEVIVLPGKSIKDAENHRQMTAVKFDGKAGVITTTDMKSHTIRIVEVGLTPDGSSVDPESIKFWELKPEGDKTNAQLLAEMMPTILTPPENSWGQPAEQCASARIALGSALKLMQEEGNTDSRTTPHELDSGVLNRRVTNLRATVSYLSPS